MRWQILHHPKGATICTLRGQLRAIPVYGLDRVVPRRSGTLQAARVAVAANAPDARVEEPRQQGASQQPRGCGPPYPFPPDRTPSHLWRPISLSLLNCNELTEQKKSSTRIYEYSGEPACWPSSSATHPIPEHNRGLEILCSVSEAPFFLGHSHLELFGTAWLLLPQRAYNSFLDAFAKRTLTCHDTEGRRRSCLHGVFHAA